MCGGGSVTLSFVDVDKLKVTERLPGWRGRYLHAVNMTVAHYEFTRGASIHEHHHPQEELYEVFEGELELTVDGVTQVARPGVAAIVVLAMQKLNGHVPGHPQRALTQPPQIVIDASLIIWAIKRNDIETISQFLNQLLRDVRSGEEVLLTLKGQAVARLVTAEPK